MAPFIQTQPSKLLARDIAAFSDAELDRYLEANRGEIQVEDPENVKRDNILLQRLRARAGAQSRPIDLDDLAARLEVASADKEAAPPRPTSPTSSTTEIYDEEEEYPHDLQKQTEYYNTLVNEGGRPSHPVSLGRDILEDPREYGEILSYWQRVNFDGEGRVWEVFWSQLCEWREFRNYQQSMRKEGRFSIYRERVQNRLTRHGFERPFQLDEDLDRQDKLATWVEFLNYEYQDYDKHMRFVERHQTEYDEAWKELVDSQVLRSFETDEFICNVKSAFQRASEEERAEKAVESAKSAVASAEKANPDPQHAHLSQQAAQHQRLGAAQSQLDAAVKSLASIKRRRNLIYKFIKKTKLHQEIDNPETGYVIVKQSYVGAKRDAEVRGVLLRWILQQIPLIEIELNQAKAAENHSGGDNSRQRRKRNSTGDHSEERVSKRRREDGGNGVLSSPRMCIAPTAQTTSQDSSSTQRQGETAGHEGQLKRNCHDATGEGRAPERRKRSGQPSSAAEPTSIAEPLSIPLNRPEPGNNVAQIPPKVYKKERKSRRLAGDSPEFGILSKQGEPALPSEPPPRYPSNAHKPNPSSLRSPISSKKKSMAVKGAKPRGVSKSRREETTGSKRSKKRSGG